MIETFKPYLLRFKWLLLATYSADILLTIVSSLLPMGGKIFIDFVLPGKAPLALIKVLDNLGMQSAAGLLQYAVSDIKGFVFFVFFFVLLLGGLQALRQIVSFFLQNRMTAQINSDLFAKIMHTSLKKHQDYERGYLNARIMADSGAFEGLARTLMPTMVNNIIRFAFGLAILSSINVAMTIICLASAPFYLFTNYFFSAQIRRLAQQNAEQSAANFAYVQNSLHGVETIKAFNLQASRIAGFRQRLDNLIDTRFKFFKTTILSSAFIKCTQIVSLLLLLFFAEAGFRNGELTTGDIVAFFSYMGFLSGPLSGMALLYINLQPALVSVKRVKEVLDFNNEEQDELREPAKQIRPSAFPEKLKFQQIYYSYNSDNSVFSDLNMELVKGRVELIDWQSGIGKTTLARLLLKFIRPEAGQIFLDGVPLENIDMALLRETIGYKPQTDFFFAGSIKENLLLARPDADDELLTEVLELCCVYEFVKSKPGFLDYRVTDGAMNLSEGQRQRLSIARVVLRDSGIVILDEPFAAIDDKNSEKIMANLQEFFKSRICIIMSHKKL